MSNDITALAHNYELLIANGQQTADLLRHLADNEIDSDYFAVVSECESYGKETDAEISITDFALRAAGYVDALVEALEAEQQKSAKQGRYACALFDEVVAQRNLIAELDKRLIEYAGIATREAHRGAELEARQIALPQRLSPEGYHIDEAYMVDDDEGEYLDRDAVIEAIRAAGIKVKGE